MTSYTVRPEYLPFSRKLAEAMQTRMLSPNDLARQMWGDTSNRDRIAHYLAGVAYPGPDDLEKMVRALGLYRADLTFNVPPSAPKIAPEGDADTLVFIEHASPEKCRVQIKTGTDTALKILELLKKHGLLG